MKRPWLAPLVPLYAAGAALRDARFRRGGESVRRLGWSVVSIGNLSTGGTGKTPFAIALAELLKQKGIHVDVLSRGYGRASGAPARVDLARVDLAGTAAEFGDEPLLIARETGVPVYVAAQRYDAGLLAEAEFAAQHAAELRSGPPAHILDDGFQHRQLARDVDILLLNEADLKDSLLPAGNLREPLRAMQRATVVAVPTGENGVEERLRDLGWKGPVWHLHRRMLLPAVAGPVVAFCGIARPEQFFAGLEAGGMEIAARRAFRDHHPYAAGDLKALAETARASGAKTLVTTEKDRVRLGGMVEILASEIRLITAPLRIEIEDGNAAVGWLVDRLRNASARRAL